MSSEHSPARQQAVAFDTIPGRAAYTIPEFCLAHRISRSALYEEWKQGTGPRRRLVRSKVTITVEAAADWRKDGEERTRAEDAKAGPAA
jgi:hypothetical protein